MDYSRVFAISAAGMTAARTALEAAARNVANADTTFVPGTAGFKPQRAVIEAVTLATGEEFNAHMAAAIPRAAVRETGAEPRLVHDPAHPHADAAGNVARPAIDTVAEMVTIMHALRSHEANVAAANATRMMALKALDIGGGT